MRDYDKISDQELLAATLAGDDAASREFVRRYRNPTINLEARFIGCSHAFGPEALRILAGGSTTGTTLNNLLSPGGATDHARSVAPPGLRGLSGAVPGGSTTG